MNFYNGYGTYLEEAAQYYRKAVTLKLEGHPQWLVDSHISSAKTALRYARQIREEYILAKVCQDWENSQ